MKITDEIETTEFTETILETETIGKIHEIGTIETTHETETRETTKEIKITEITQGIEATKTIFETEVIGIVRTETRATGTLKTTQQPRSTTINQMIIRDRQV